MHFTFGSPYLLALLLLLPCFLWCKQYSKPYYFPKLSWVTRQSPLFSWEAWIKMSLFALMILALAKPFVYDARSDQHRKGRDLILAIDASVGYQSIACTTTVDESFSDDDSAFFKQHGDFMHDEKILESHMSAADTRVIRRARKLILYVGFAYCNK